MGHLWKLFVEFQSLQLEPTTIYANYNVVGNIIRRLPTKSLAHAAKIRSWLVQNTSQLMAWRYLLRFDQCCRWAVDEGLIESNPFANLKIKKPKGSSGACKAFSIDQRDLIIQSFEDHEQHKHYASLIKFLFWTGCRHGEAFALLWKDISPCCQFITFSKSRNLLGLEKSTKNRKTRIFQCSSDSRLHSLLVSLSASRTEESYVFTTIRGRPVCSTLLGYAWNRSKDGLPGVIRDLECKGVPYLKPYSTRHTFATWAIALGATPDKVAYWIGDDTETVLRYYVHPEVSKSACPDF
jgi:integrase